VATTQSDTTAVEGRVAWKIVRPAVARALWQFGNRVETRLAVFPATVIGVLKAAR
jgi:hypothetical protein